VLEGRVHEVAEGRHGRLFIADYGAPDNDEMLVEAPFNSRLANLWRARLERYAGFLAARGVPLVLLVAPDAYTAAAEDLPEGWPRPGPVGQPFKDAMAGVENLTVVFPLVDLMQASGGLPIYKTCDTHWSAYGAFVAYQALLAALPASLDIQRITARDIAFGWREVYGDLGVNVDRKETIPFAQLSIDEPQKVSMTMGPQRRACQVLRNRRLKSRALVLRDSFATEMSPYLNATFGELWTAGPAQALDAAMVEAAEPDVVIIQTSERRLLRHRPESEEVGWRELFETDMKSPAGKVCGRLCEALERKAFDEAADLAAEVAAADGLQVQHLIFCALACQRAGRDDDMSGYARRAFRMDKSYPSVWRLLALAELARPEPDEAAFSRLMQRAFRLAPQNPLYRHDYGQGLTRIGRWDEARAVLTAAIAAFPDAPDLRIALARILERAGDRDGAVAQRDRALELQPRRGGRTERIAGRLRAGGTWRG
jgi:tetratricopeptide (TPR) repeat protein